MTKLTTLSIRSLLAIDAITCAVMGAFLMVESRSLEILTAIPGALLFYAGVVLIPVSAFMAIVATFRRPSLPACRVVIIGNLAWVVMSIILPLALISPNLLGWVFLFGQAAVVAVLAKLERDAVVETAAA